MKKANELLYLIENDSVFNNLNGLIATINTARSNNNIKKLILLNKNISSVSSVISNKISEWSKDSVNDFRIASLLIILSDLCCSEDALILSRRLCSIPHLDITRLIAISILIKESLYGSRSAK